MKKKFLFLFLLLVPFFSYADILFQAGVLNIEHLTEEIPEAKELKEKWDKTINKKYFLLHILEVERNLLNSFNKPVLLSEKLAFYSKIAWLNQQIDELQKKQEKDLQKLKAADETELKKKIFLAIKSARRKKGFSMILSSKAEVIIYYDEKIDFNPMVLEELLPEGVEESQD